MANVTINGYTAETEETRQARSGADGFPVTMSWSGYKPLGKVPNYGENEPEPDYIVKIKEFCNKIYFDEVFKGANPSNVVESYRDLDKALIDMEFHWRASAFVAMTEHTYNWILAQWLTMDKNLTEEEKAEEERILLWLLWAIKTKYGSVSGGLLSLMKKDFKKQLNDIKERTYPIGQ